MAGLPTAANVVAALASAGITLSEAGAAAPLATAIDLWESTTGWGPFVSSGTPAESALYVPSSGLHRILGLGGGVLASVAVTVTLDTVALTAGTDYQLCPAGAPRTLKPYTYLKLLNRSVSASSALVVSGAWGYCTSSSVPPLVIAAILARACYEAAQPLMQAEALEGGTKQKVDQGTVTIEYGSTMTERMQAIKGWESTWQSAVGAYSRNQVA